MRRASLAVAVLVAALALVLASGVGAAEPVRTPAIDAAAWYLVGEDGAVLAQRASRRERAVASITKLMTAVVVLEHARPGDVVRVSPRAAAIGESTVYLRAGEELTVGTLVRALLVPSANDAAQALAVHVGRGSVDGFVALMNAKARELGLSDTRFVNPHGLDQAGHVSSARDATVLLRYALGVPLVRDALSRESVMLPGGRDFETTDDLVRSWPALLGGKTGHTRAAGWSQAAAARGRGVTVYGTVLGSETRQARNDALRELLAFGLRQYRTVSVVDGERVYGEAASGYGRPAVRLVAPRELIRTLRTGTSFVEHVVAPQTASLPVEQGSPLGRVDIYVAGRLLATSPLVAAEGVSEPGLLGKARWYATRTLENLREMVT